MDLFSLAQWLKHSKRAKIRTSATNVTYNQEDIEHYQHILLFGIIVDMSEKSPNLHIVQNSCLANMVSFQMYDLSSCIPPLGPDHQVFATLCGL